MLQGLLVGAAAWYTVADWRVPYFWWVYPVPNSPAGWFDLCYPGHRLAAEWLRAHAVPSVRALPYATDITFYQRLSELIYPIDVVEGAASDFQSGELVVLPVGSELPRPVDELLPGNPVRIVRVR